MPVCMQYDEVSFFVLSFARRRPSRFEYDVFEQRSAAGQAIYFIINFSFLFSSNKICRFHFDYLMACFRIIKVFTTLNNKRKWKTQIKPQWLNTSFGWIGFICRKQWIIGKMLRCPFKSIAVLKRKLSFRNCKPVYFQYFIRSFRSINEIQIW